MAAILVDIKPGDEVIVPAYTFVSTANAFILRGARIIFADSEEQCPNLDVKKLEPLITPKTRAVVPVHYGGVACDMDPLMGLAEKYGLFVIEDAAHAVESYYKGKPLGSIGHLGAFSFHETKNVTSGEGGMLAVNDHRFRRRAEIIWEKGTNRAEFFRGGIDKYGWVDIGSSFLPSDINAAFLYAQLENLESIQGKKLHLILGQFTHGITFYIMGLSPVLIRAVYVLFVLLPISCLVYRILHRKMGFPVIAAYSAAVLPDILPAQVQIPVYVNGSHVLLGLLAALVSLAAAFEYLDTPGSRKIFFTAVLFYFAATLITDQPVFFFPVLVFAILGYNKLNREHLLLAGSFSLVFLHKATWMYLVPRASSRMELPSLLMVISLYAVLKKVAAKKNKWIYLFFVSLVVVSGVSRFLELKPSYDRDNDNRTKIIGQLSRFKFPERSQIVIYLRQANNFRGNWRKSSGNLKYMLKRSDIDGLIGPKRKRYFNFYAPFRVEDRNPMKGNYMSGLRLSRPLFLFVETKKKFEQYGYALQWKTKGGPGVPRWTVFHFDKQTGKASGVASGTGMDEYLSALARLSRSGIKQEDILWGGKALDRSPAPLGL